MTKIEIQKRNAEEVACWKVDVEGATPNTVVENNDNLALLIKVDGHAMTTVKSAFTLNFLVSGEKSANPLATKLIGGNKPYKNVEIYAVDRSSQFSAEWGLAGNNAIPCYDRENGVDCLAVAFGEYYYKIEDFRGFVASMAFDAKGEISRSNVREYLRAETAGVIKSYLTSALGAADLRTCQGNMGEFAEDIKEQINKHLDSKGLTVYNFVISRLSYDKSHEAKRGILDDAKLGVKLKKIGNEGRLDDVKVKKAETDIEIDLIKAHGEASGKMHSPKKKDDDAVVVFCTRCGTKNENALYCKKCGEKLAK